ncbi:MAG: DEAD/DEAH box helicase family protein [Galactobacillus timonensis]|uniref:DEAD/DEAH box helicase n=1 Tax=Galactobacillus timonensis TaxID=2041840 RepID=UPI00240A27BD|nr:DEAD/DEAH box helicase family protein [Galactobacillus timonensis]MDD6599200.1 DEAD/DEAH box helicase family protein [Galactobacillus timonensis]
MKAELFPFQKRALSELRMKSAEAVYRYGRSHSKQVVSFTAPTGAGKTIIMAALIESIFFGDEVYPEQPEAIIVWLSDSPQLNEQSKDKIDLKADKIRLGQCVTVQDDSFDQEMFDDGHIYFLNTQKLGKSSNLTKHTDNRQYTIWETLANTARDKSDRLYFIIDEAHRGMQGREAGRATTIMQKFLKGSPADGIEAMPVVIGMSATSARFNALVQGIASDTQYVVVTTDEVRASGLLKDRIVISYPEENSGNKDMAVLQAAADEWKDKWDHWYQYCYEQHYAYVNPILVIQVQNATSSSISATDLHDCVQKIEERTGIRFREGEVVHTFGDANNVIRINGLNVPYVAPSAIAEDKRIRVVFFKESLSTGWDCPRAETMMSFRHATDATYIAQLLGRMIRTPMQMHIQVDETLNDVHLYLPYFNSDTVKEVVEELQNAEGGDIPADIYGESLDTRVMDTLSVRPRSSASGGTRHTPAYPGQMSMFDLPGGTQPMELHDGGATPYGSGGQTGTASGVREASSFSTGTRGTQQENPQQVQPAQNVDRPSAAVPSSGASQAAPEGQTAQSEPEYVQESFIDTLDREGVVKAINDSGLLSYDVRNVRINNYLNSLYSLARLLRQSGKYQDATDDVLEEIVKMIREYVGDLKRDGKYDDMAKKIMEFQMKSQVFDVFGETVDDNIVHMFMSTTDIDIDRQFRRAETKLGNEGVGNKYGHYYYDEDDPNAYKIDVILYASNDDCYARLLAYAEKAFHKMNDNYRRKIVGLGDRFIKQYDAIVSNGDVVSKHNFRLPETISLPHEVNGKDYDDHLFVDDSGKARINLNTWEEGVLVEEQSQADYVCWLRNPPRKPWSLCIPYEMGGEQKPAYPDFVIIRKDSDDEYVVDILEPHDPTRIDNLGKARGFAEYARQNPGVGRIQLIRMSKDAVGHNRFKRLDMAMSAVRDKVSRAMTNDELDHIFDTDGFFM